MIHSFRATFVNIKTGESRILLFDSPKSFIEAWEDAISHFNGELIKLDKNWVYSKVEHY